MPTLTGELLRSKLMCLNQVVQERFWLATGNPPYSIAPYWS